MEEINIKTIGFYRKLRRRYRMLAFIFLIFGFLNALFAITISESFFFINMLASVFSFATMQKDFSKASLIDFNINRYEYLVNLANKYSKENLDRVQTLFDQSSCRVRHGLDWESSVERLKNELKKEFGEQE